MPAYNYVSFDVPVPGAATFAEDINNVGQIAGFYYDSNNVAHGFLDVGGVFTTLDDPNGVSGTEILGLNDSGQMVGAYFTPGTGGALIGHAFLYSNGLFTDLTLPSNLNPPPRGYTIATAINNSGEIVGYYDFFDGQRGFGFADNNGTFTTFGNISGTYPGDVGDSGLIVGTQYAGTINPTQPHGFLDNAGNFTFFSDPYGPNTSTGQGINSTGQIVGTYSDNFGTHGYINNSGTYSTLDDPSAIFGQTYVTGLNDSGQIIGYYADNQGTHGFIATPTTTPVDSQFNSDNYSDILWQNDNGTAGIWLMSSDGVTPMTEQGVGMNPGAAWHIKAIGDFNGDQHSDILWQNDNGTAGVWIMGADGFTPAEEVGVGTNPGPNFHVKAAADFNGDGYADILWQDDAGQAGVWLMASNGYAPANEQAIGINPGPAWHIKAAADFDGDGHADILWQNDNGTAGVWLMSADGFTPKAEVGVGINPGPTWHIKAAADFDGDGHADILWQNDNGTAGIWLMSADGVTPKVEVGVGANPGPNFHIVGAADYNGDGHADILWQDDNGQAGVWLMGADGVTPMQESAVGDNPGSSWHIVGLVA